MHDASLENATYRYVQRAVAPGSSFILDRTKRNWRDGVAGNVKIGGSPFLLERLVMHDNAASHTAVVCRQEANECPCDSVKVACHLLAFEILPEFFGRLHGMYL